MIPFTLLQKSGPEERGGRGAVICMMMEAQKGGPYRLPREGVLSCQLLAIPAASIVSTLVPNRLSLLELSIATKAFTRGVAYCCILLSTHPPPPAGKLTNEKSGKATQQILVQLPEFDSCMRQL